MTRLPFNLPFELCEIIFNQSLTIKDLLSCVLVSRDWESFIIKSQCFDKVKIKIDQSVELRRVLESNRCFKQFNFVKTTDIKILDFLAVYNCAKKVEICGCYPNEDTGCTLSKHILPQLEELTLSNISDCIIQPFVTPENKNLKVLDLHNLKLTNVSDLIKLLQLNVNLKDLNFYFNETCNLFDQELLDVFQFTLESLTISYKSSVEIDVNVMTNIERFLRSQGGTLRTITLINAASLSSVHRMWNCLKSVERFYFFSGDPFFERSVNPQLEVRETLKSMEIHVLGPTQLNITEDLLPLLKATKQLDSLGVWHLSKDLIKFCATNMTNLRNLSCATMESDSESFYTELKSKNEINKTIQLHQYL